ncbi:MAG: hypothetical protein Q8O41_00855, partial [Candidatus Methanoperedens sp.]|nr:hypothetical protein [Candidatus Methanoperedens sp.]
KEALRTVTAAQPVEEKPVIETAITPPIKPMETELVVESIKNLNASVNMMYGLIKTVIVPVLVLILIIGIALLVKPK